MLRALLSALFYARFYTQFSRRGLRRRQAQWQPYAEDLHGQVWVVSGASGGIGAAIARRACARGATVWALARSADKLAALAQACASTAGSLRPLVVDFSSLADTRRAVQALQSGGAPIDVLVNNVGVLQDRYLRTAEGLEQSCASNLLSHYVLTEGLRAAAAYAPGAAVINMSSGGMYGARLDLAALQAERAEDHDGMAAYAQHKRAQVVLTAAWNRRWQGQPRVYVMHPGWVDTAGVQTALPWFRAVLKSRLRTPEEGADTALWLGTTRPPVADGIWLDRVLDPEHAFAYTEHSRYRPEDLLDWLAAQTRPG